MVNEKVASIASQAASDKMLAIITSIYTEPMPNEDGVYYHVFTTLMVKCGITPEIFEQRLRAYAEEHVSPPDVNALVGNLLKEATRKEMGYKIFKRLIRVVFPKQ